MRTIPQKGGLLSIYLVKNSDWHLFLIISWSLPCALYVSIVSSSSDISICCVSCIAILHHMLPAVSVVRNRYWKDGPDEMSSATSVAAPSPNMYSVMNHIPKPCLDRVVITQQAESLTCIGSAQARKGMRALASFVRAVEFHARLKFDAGITQTLRMWCDIALHQDCTTLTGFIQGWGRVRYSTQPTGRSCWHALYIDPSTI